jgi:hypothetical protein
MTDDEIKAYLDSLPVDDEPLTEAELRGIAEGYADIAAGRVMTTEELLRSLGITRDGEPLPEA